MVRGKQTCKILKDIRRQIAEANDIEYITSNVNTKGLYGYMSQMRGRSAVSGATTGT